MEGDLEVDLKGIIEGGSKGDFKQDLFELDIEVITNLYPVLFIFRTHKKIYVWPSGVI